ncbi:uncharacterized protein LOC143018082 [Oratosquilla oratoria]|uniref:uncharacterized protein LOC143018082 n=1 Tax=Oratosquilla oratoria TaxID=337810 RepID=UPI003F76E678
MIKKRIEDKKERLKIIEMVRIQKEDRTLQNKQESSLCYKIQGKVYHKIGILKPELIAGKEKPFWKSDNSFLNLYFYHDKKQQLKLRVQRMCDLFYPHKDKLQKESKKRREREENEVVKNETIISQLYDCLVVNNICLSGMLKEVESSRQLIDDYVKKTDKIPDMSITLKTAEGINTRNHKGVYHLPTSSSQYPLLILNGDIGYSYKMTKKCQPGKKEGKYNRLSPAMFYSSLYMEKEGVFNYITKGRRLFQVVLPPNFVGGPRYMKQRQQDALAYVSYYGSPDYFITFTMNPNWSELREGMNKTGSTETKSCDRPDLATMNHTFVVRANIREHKNVEKVSLRLAEMIYCLETMDTQNTKEDRLEKEYNAHINVECSNSIKCIAYVTKYVNKGCDRILFTKTSDNGDVNEVKNYQEARFVNANEATWKIFKFDIHKNYPPVTTLDLHLEGENEVFYTDNTSEEEMKKKTNKDTQLTAFFKLCSNNSFAADLHFHEVPRHFIYNANTSSWEERKGRTFSLGRIRAVTTKTVELFYLRLLLTHKPGPTSYEDLRTIDGKMYPSNREAVKALGLLADEETWKNTILEIINHTNDRKQLRETYASMLVFSDLENQSGIWEETKDLFASDYLHINNSTEYNDEIYLDALDDIQKHVWNCGGGSITKYGLPPSRGGEKTSNVVRRERSYNKEKLKEEVAQKELLLNDKQKQVYDAVMYRVHFGHRYKNNGIFVNAAGGTGKSFVLNKLLDSVRSQGKIALAVASSGIAATVLKGGRTAHNIFKIPLMEYNKVRSCSIKKNSELAKLLELTSLIVWDEVVMANKNTLTALDITLRDVLENEKFMGGKVFVCAGDFRQILPVIRGGGKNEELEHCIKSSYMWNDLTKLELTENVRLKKDDTKNILFLRNYYNWDLKVRVPLNSTKTLV